MHISAEIKIGQDDLSQFILYICFLNLWDSLYYTLGMITVTIIDYQIP